jgi:hypothetical protein
MNTHQIRVADKETGTECIKSFDGLDRRCAQLVAIEDGWVLAEKMAPESHIATNRPIWWTRFWNAEDPAERAIVRGICKAYCIILWYTAVWAVLAAIAVGFYLLIRNANP